MRWLNVPKVPGSIGLTALLICSAHLQVQVVLRGYCGVKVGVTASQLDLSSLTPLYVAGCGLLQLGAAKWATSAALLQVVNN